MLILASQSPRRRELMDRMELSYEIRVPDVDESIPKGMPPDRAVVMLAQRKAQAVTREQGDIIIAADTLVVFNAEVLGKPVDRADAQRMLQMLQGQIHQVVTGLCVLGDTGEHALCERAEVTMDALSPEEIERYIRTGEPMDKAGAYAVQGLGGMYILSINGNYDAVMGLPTSRLRQLLIKFGYWV